jgi:HNH endonuclease
MRDNTSPELFWPQVNSCGSDACWEWTGYCDRKGYGKTFWGGRKQRAHRVAYELTYGPIPEGLNILHKCDNPPCCNPTHLIVGTQHENNTDKKTKGRQFHPLGERNPKVKLSWEKVREIRKMYSEGVPQYLLAEQFSVTRASIYDIVNHKHWKEPL